jgi:transposase
MVKETVVKEKKSIASDPIDKMYSTQYVADMFDVTAETVRNWINAGKLESIQVNGYHKIPRRALLAFANSRYGS